MDLPQEFLAISSAVSELKAENNTLKQRNADLEKNYREAFERSNSIEEAYKKLVKEVDEWDEHLSVTDKGEIKDTQYEEFERENEILAARCDELLAKNIQLETECASFRQKNSELELLVKQAPAMSGLIEDLKLKLQL
jgi:chromosome segregation ATPase